ncbi:MAG: DUF2330 domain-containing protein [Bacteroidota bacterium]
MQRLFLLLLSFLLLSGQANAFCGFYAAKLSANLFNKASAVIIARSGNQTVITMASDVQGSVKDFAMIVPVPVVLKRNQVRLAQQNIFSKLEQYSSPRLVEYYDPHPCYQKSLMEEDEEMLDDLEMEVEPTSMAAPAIERDYGVTIVEQYSVGEYDILILSAEESGGLETWLKKEGYKIPEKAADVLEPYIKSDMKFFVVKVNLDRQAGGEAQQLRPIQMSFRSDKFMLPIRLGMANAKGDQDMIVYGFSDQGRIETANYRTVEIPSNVDVPSNLKTDFDQFYRDLFTNAWKKNGKNAVMLEYAWNLSGYNYVKCDPCNGPPPIYADLRESGVFWVQGNPSGYQGEVHFTRLHVRYNRETFPQDLQFQATPNKQAFQGRYVMRHPPQGADFSCMGGQQYLKALHERRQAEVTNLANLTAWSTSKYETYVSEYDRFIQGDYQPFFGPLPEENDNKGFILVLPFHFDGWGGTMLLILGFGLCFLLLRRTLILRRLAPLGLFLLLPAMGQAFCGFYVAKVDTKVFNKASSVILVRDGRQSVVTMSSDFDGPVQDFAMVVPVPEVLQRSQIRLANPKIFDKLDAYSGPRLVQYFEQSPCYRAMELESVQLSAVSVGRAQKFKRSAKRDRKEYGVQVEEQYEVGEYDIIILSAKESDGLERWLTDNGYKIPVGASEVLEPYIKSNLKFFVVKVNEKNFQFQGKAELSPIQITYRTDKFMLPIRLGMANAKGDQDMIVYAFTRNGRIETANYRTVPIPTNWNVPNDLRPRFSQFYKATFDKAWANAGKNAVMLEYAWDLSGVNPVKCDPCNGPPPMYYDLREAGVVWLKATNQSYTGSVFMTRLHVRYNRETFPQDLQFQITPSKEKFQGRYVMHQMNGYGDFQCDAAQDFLKKVRDRRQDEVENLAMLTNWSTGQYASYVSQYDQFIKEDSNGYFEALPEEDEDDHNKGFLWWFTFGGTLLLLALAPLFYRSAQRYQLKRLERQLA